MSASFNDNPAPDSSAAAPAADDPGYAVFPIHNSQGGLIDISAGADGREFKMLGPAGAEREQSLAHAFLNSLAPDSLPVLLGSGLGHALDYLLERWDGPLAVVDKENAILAHTGLGPQLDPRLTFISDPDPAEAVNLLTAWQQKNGNRPMAPLVHPFYLRLGGRHRAYYQKISETLKASRTFNFWEKVSYPRFAEKLPRILLITRQYFLIGEIIEACQVLGAPYRLFQVSTEDVAQEDFIENLLKAVLEFKPDFVFTINHLGVDREGLLVDLLERLNLPLASWFVDNPHLILYQYQGLASPWTCIFTWDADNIRTLEADGFRHVHYLPLATTPERFTRRPGFTVPKAWESDVSFVGNSMRYKVKARIEAAGPGPELLEAYERVAAGFAAHDSRSALSYLKLAHPELLPAYNALETRERKLAFETLLTWEATRQYREQCLEGILPFNPLILGDDGWQESFGASPHPWRWHSEISYYDELPFFYPHSQINFNCTSKQMKGAVNQRVFDVPAAGAFVLTDWREQMDQLFEPEKEVIFYRHPEEVPELVRFYLKRPAVRAKIVEAARRRIFAQHTYILRLKEIIGEMKRIYG
ncbi:MAG: glycosyltransferase [Desulfovibrionaceae bacterium]|nr:glycosyltransferase [Desulfovibrionaceae bacterium]